MLCAGGRTGCKEPEPFKKGIWDYQVREEIITKGTGRETQERRELGKRRGNLCEEERRRGKKGSSRLENESKFQTGKTAGTFITVKLSKSREMKTGDNLDVTAELLRRHFRCVFAVKSTEFSEHQRHEKEDANVGKRAGQIQENNPEITRLSAVFSGGPLCRVLCWIRVWMNWHGLTLVGNCGLLLRSQW